MIRALERAVKEQVDDGVAFSERPLFRFVPEQTHCAVCQGPLQSYKTTQPRTVVTLADGEFQAVEQLRYCPQHPWGGLPAAAHQEPGPSRQRLVYRSDQLRAVVPPKHKYGYDLVAHVGRRYFLECRNEEEILEALAAPPDPLSFPRRSLSRLTEQFLGFVAAAHAKAIPRLQKLFADNGGYVLCVDGTCEAGSPVHLVCQDAVTQIVLAAFKLGSENKAELKQSLQRVQEQFGSPVATMGDLRKELRTIRAELWPGVPHFFCHTHFVSDVGKDLLQPSHDALGALFKASKLSSALIEKRRYLGKRMRDCLEDHPLRLDELLEQAKQSEPQRLSGAALERLSADAREGLPSGELEQLEREQLTKVILWIQAHASDGRGQGFPFDLPNLAYYRRCAQAHQLLGDWLQQPLPGSRQRQHVEKLYHLLTPLVQGDDFRQAVADVEWVQADFLRLREVLRVFPTDGPGGLAPDDAFNSPAEVEDREREAKAFCEELRERLKPHANARELQQRAAQIIVRHLDKYWDGLFGHVLLTDNGGVLLVVRTNNGLEIVHRFHKRRRRRLHGRRSVKHDLERWPAAYSLLHNLSNPLYLELVYGSLDNMPHRFAEVFDQLDHVEAQSQPAQATIRLRPAERKGTLLLERLTRIRRAVIVG